MANYSDSIEISLQRNNDIDNLNDGVKQFMLVKYVESDIESYSYGGWKAELLINKLTPIEEKLLICSTCHGVMRDAVFYGKVSTCEVCVSIEGFDSAFDNGTARDIIKSLKIKCPLIEEGCDWTGAIETLTTHFPSCLYYPVPCPLECTVIDNNTAELVITTLPRHEVESHVTETCPYRQINCEFCNASIKAAEMNIHLSGCQEFPLVCLNKCIDPQSDEFTQLQRKEMNNHINKFCPNSELDCPFQSSGCTAGKILRKDLATHEQDSTLEHLRLMNKKLEEKDNKISSLQYQIINELQQTKMQIQELKNHLDNQVNDILTKYNGLNRRVDLQERKINRINAKISFEWSIANLGNHLAKRSQLESKSFYLSNYKCFCSVQFQIYKKDSFGFYAHFTPGAYDKSLEWPFSGSGKFILINQDDATDNYVQIVKSDANNFQMFKKPTSGPNVGWGFREFIEFSNLSPGGKYRKMDSIILSFELN